MHFIQTSLWWKKTFFDNREITQTETEIGVRVSTTKGV